MTLVCICLFYYHAFPHIRTRTRNYISCAFYIHGFTLIPAWTSHYIHYKMWHAITCPFPNFNGITVEVWLRISNFIPHFMIIAIIYTMLRWKLNYVSKGGPSCLLSNVNYSSMSSYSYIPYWRLMFINWNCCVQENLYQFYPNALAAGREGCPFH